MNMLRNRLLRAELGKGVQNGEVGKKSLLRRLRDRDIGPLELRGNTSYTDSGGMQTARACLV